MHFLIDASLPRPTADVILAAHHHATDVRDIGLGSAADGDIAELARLRQLAIITADNDFGNIRDYPPADYAGIVVIQPPDGATRAIVLSIIKHSFNKRTSSLNFLAD